MRESIAESDPAVRVPDHRIFATLSSTFGYSTFRPLQAEIVRAILQQKDVFVLMPTGGGKSLCYQLPALLLNGTTVVVSPLIALMKDQVDALRTLGVAATYINSSLDLSEVSHRQRLVAQGAVKLLYVAPERLMQPGFLRLLEQTKVSLFAIDEAHCISEWGHDFRPEYRELSRLRELFPHVPFGAFTATATRRVQADIRSQLRLQDAPGFQGSFNRPNLFYEVRPKQGAYAQLSAYLRAHPDASGIIYCASRQGTESLATRLNSDGFSAEAYHAGLEAGERRKRQEAFIKDDVHIMTATIAFGMGIDKPDVRFVVHYDLPKTLENYYQESGRAGRDGEPSECILFYSPADVMKIRHFIAEKPEAEQRIALYQLREMADWAESESCRRRALLAYFDEPFSGQDEPCCDVCQIPSAQEDVTIPAQMFLSCVARTHERFGASHVINVLRGSRNQKILKLGHDRLSTYGIGRDRSDTEWQRLARELIHGGYLFQDQERFNILQITTRGRAVLFDGEKVTMTVRRRMHDADGMEDQPHPVLFDRLRALRKRLADGRGLPPYMIFHDRALRQMAAELPTSGEQLLPIPGVSERKLHDFGHHFLTVIAEYVQETGAEPVPFTPPPPRVRAPKEGLSDTIHATLDLFRQGHDVAAIARLRGLAVVTIEGHLVEAMEAGEEVEIDRVVSVEKRRAIEAAIAVVGVGPLKPVMEQLGEGYTYAELRFVRAAQA